MIEILTSPRLFFDRFAKRKPSPLRGFLVAMTAMILLMTAKWLALRTVPGAAGFALRLPAWLVVPSAGIFGALFIWGALTFGLVPVLGDSSRTAETVGWSFAPWVMAGILQSVVASWRPAHVQLIPRPQGVLDRFVWAAKMQTAAQKTLTFRVFTALELAALLWGAYLLFLALRAWKPSRATVATAAYLTLMAGFWLLRNMPSLR